MPQLIIEFDRDGGWRHKYKSIKTRCFKSLVVPYSMRRRDWVLGVTVDNTAAWRKKLDNHTKNAEYDIVVKAKQ